MAEELVVNAVGQFEKICDVEKLVSFDWFYQYSVGYPHRIANLEW